MSHWEWSASFIEKYIYIYRARWIVKINENILSYTDKKRNILIDKNDIYFIPILENRSPFRMSVCENKLIYYKMSELPWNILVICAIVIIDEVNGITTRINKIKNLTNSCGRTWKCTHIS